MKNAYELREIALALMGGGWTVADKGLFIEENAKQDEENIFSIDEIEAIFDEIASEGNAESMIVTNSYGVKIDFNAAVNLMDDDIREAIHAIGTHDDDLQGFFDAYCAAHAAEFGELWELDKRNPVY